MPLLSTMDPLVTLAPPSTDPVVTYAAPELPCPVVPLLNTTLPESPAVTAFADRTVTRPDDDTPPSPLTTLMDPPFDVVCVVTPADTYTSPPAPELVEPTVSDMDPADPEVAAPDAMDT